jgi:hypothetical protein
MDEDETWNGRYKSLFDASNTLKTIDGFPKAKIIDYIEASTIQSIRLTECLNPKLSENLNKKIKNEIEKFLKTLKASVIDVDKLTKELYPKTNTLKASVIDVDKLTKTKPKVNIGPRGGNYITVMGKKKYI